MMDPKLERSRSQDNRVGANMAQVCTTAPGLPPGEDPEEWDPWRGSATIGSHTTEFPCIATVSSMLVDCGVSATPLIIPMEHTLTCEKKLA